MITEFKTALLGGEKRSEPADCDVRTVDPFRPATYIDDDVPQNAVSMDQVFGILSNQRRRYALKYLSTSEGSVSLGELAEQISAWECGKAVEQISSTERKRVYVSLYQCHLPRMADVGAISYDERAGTIESGDTVDRFTHYLRDDE